MKCDKLFHPACLIFVAVTYETMAQLYKLLIAQQTESLWVCSPGRRRPNKSILYRNPAAQPERIRVPDGAKNTFGARLADWNCSTTTKPLCVSLLTSNIVVVVVSESFLTYFQQILLVYQQKILVYQQKVRNKIYCTLSIILFFQEESNILMNLLATQNFVQSNAL